MALDEIEAASSASLQELLHLDDRPTVHAKSDESDRAGDDLIQGLADGSNRVICSVLGYEEHAAVMPFIVPVLATNDDGGSVWTNQSYVSVHWHFKKTPLCWASVNTQNRPGMIT